MTVYSAMPQAILHGIKDNSIRTPTPAQEELPMHLPLSLFFAERGLSETQLCGGADATDFYGINTFADHTEYQNHATVMWNVINATGNVQMTKRLIPNDAAKASLRLSLETVEFDVPQYQRNADGSYVLDSAGDPVPVTSGDLVKPGYKYRWLVTNAGTTFATEQVKEGTLVGRAGVRSDVYPILDFRVSTHGKYGNNVGLSLSMPTLATTTEADEDSILANDAMQFVLSFVERASANSSGIIQSTLNGEESATFTLKEDTTNPQFGTNLAMSKVMPESYSDYDSVGFMPVYGPMDEFHIYDSNVVNAFGAMATAENTANNAFPDVAHMFNPITNTDLDGIPNYATTLVGPEEGGVLMDAGFYHYASGGSDGTIGNDNLNAKVIEFFDNFADGDEDYLDSAAFPFSVFWDSGFSLEAKLSSLAIIGHRKDVYVVTATQDAAEDQNTPAEDQSMAILLRARARLYPESTLYGTATCRAMVVKSSGILLKTQSVYDKLLPLTIDLAHKFARYMGSADGNMNSVYAVDAEGVNHVSMFRVSSVNGVYRSPRNAAADWAAGMVGAQRYNRQSLFYPGLQTVYDNDTSILNSAMNMVIAVELEKVCERVWRSLSGNSKYTINKLLERSNELIVEQSGSARFDGRVVVVPESYRSKQDELRGYSWSCNVHMYGNNNVTVGSFTVVGERMSELQA